MDLANSAGYRWEVSQRDEAGVRLASQRHFRSQCHSPPLECTRGLLLCLKASQQISSIVGMVSAFPESID